jgi:hypothetical protein
VPRPSTDKFANALGRRIKFASDACPESLEGLWAKHVLDDTSTVRLEYSRMSSKVAMLRRVVRRLLALIQIPKVIVVCLLYIRQLNFDPIRFRQPY